MSVELAEIRDFLAAHAPFDGLPDDVLDRLPASLSVRYLRRGTPVPPPDADRAYLYIVRQGAVETRDRRGELVDKQGEGGLYAAPCTANGPEAALASLTAEDTLFYLLPCERLEALRREHTDFGRHFDASVAERLRKALDLLQESSPGGTGLLTVTVGELARRPPVTVGPQESLRDAASRMTRERVSSLLVMDGGTLVGLLTDRDLRSRAVAAGLDAATPVHAIMTANVHTVGSATPALDALLQMTQLNIHHLPVVDGTRVTGMVSTTDLIRHESANAVYLVGAVHKAGSLDALAAVGHALPELQAQLAFAGATERHVGEAVSAVNDALTRRLIDLAKAQLGAPPVRYAWVAGGSQARREQSARSDQDNALILADEATPEDDRYFEALARFVNDGLNACGLPYCPGEVMASNPKWRQPAARWREYFDAWINEPEPMALMLASVFFDLRVIDGDADLLDQLRGETLEASRSNGIFLAYMTDNALKHRPPLGFFRNLVLVHGGEHDRTLDLKRRGVLPVVNLARVYALAEGRAEINTVERLHAAAGTPSLTHEGARNLEDAYAFIGSVRIRHQARQVRAGVNPDHYLEPAELSPLERGHLKDAFGVVAMMQQTLQRRFPPGAYH